MTIKNTSNQDRWDFKNPAELQEFEVGDSLLFHGQVLKICFVSGLAGIKTQSEDGHYFTIDNCGFANYVSENLNQLLSHYADQDLIIKVKANGFERGYVIYEPVYETQNTNGSTEK